MASVAASWRTIEEELWENAHSLYRAIRKPASEAQISRLAKRVPVKLPRDFLQSLRIHDGLRDSYLGRNRLFDNHALLPLSAIIALCVGICDLPTECGFSGTLAGCDPRIRNDAHWRPGWVPIMDADGDKIVLDLDPALGVSIGQVFEWSNTGSAPLRVLSSSYGDWSANLAETLGNRRFSLNQFGSIWLTRSASNATDPASP